MDKKFIISCVLSLLTVWAIQTYWGKKNIQRDAENIVKVGGTGASFLEAGHPIKVPTREDLYKPISTTVSFADEKIKAAEEVVTLENNVVISKFSSFGGILTSLDFKNYKGKFGAPLRTVYTHGSSENLQRERGTFLLALDEQTPYLYSLVERKSLQDRQEIIFQADHPSCVINKKYILYHNAYQIDLVISINPKEHERNYRIKPRLFFAAPYVHEVENDAITLVMLNEKTQKIDKKDEHVEENLVWYWNGTQRVFGACDKYFVHALFNDQERFVQRAFYKHTDAKNVMAILEGPAVANEQSWTLSFYCGPKDYKHLTQADAKLPEILSFGRFTTVCKFLLRLLERLFEYLGNYGFAIIVLAVLVRLPFLPFTLYIRNKMVRYQKHSATIMRIRTKYKNDMQLQQQEIMRYHQEHDLSPATSMLGCLPLLLQIPVFYSLYLVLNNYVSLYQAPFIGWIHDLSAKDPYYVLPILMGISAIWHQQMTSQGDEKQKMIMLFIPIIMVVTFASFPSGLVLYWFINNLLTVGEEYLRIYFFNK